MVSERGEDCGGMRYNSGPSLAQARNPPQAWRRDVTGASSNSGLDDYRVDSICSKCGKVTLLCECVEGSDNRVVVHGTIIEKKKLVRVFDP